MWVMACLARAGVIAGTLIFWSNALKTTLVSVTAVTLASLCLFAAGTEGLRKAPELAFTIPGEGQKLLSQYRGKVVALEFILTTCPHCQAASHVMTQFQQEYGPRGFQALDVAINALDDGRTEAQAAQVVQAFAQNFQVGFPVGYISRDQMMAFMGFSMAERMVVPQLVMIDRKGYIHYQTPASDADGTWGKLMDENAIRQHIEELLATGNSSSGHRARPSHSAAVAKKS
jgi:thiol-disulfide isomerase/thioredoxin